MNRQTGYRILCGALGALMAVVGVIFFVTFFGYQQPGSTPSLKTGPVGHYFVAFTGCALIGWAGGLLGAARHPATSRTVGTLTAFALVLSALYRMVAWVIGDYYVVLGELPRFEAALFLLLALGFVWLRPPAPGKEATA